MDCTKEAFLEEFGIRKEEFKKADISWEDLLKIEADYENRKTELEQVRKDFMKDYIIDKSCGLHSFSSRVKDSKHLIAKIIRKRYDNYTKYENLTVDNYYYFVTDLIGVRGLILYREDWIDFHKYILEKFKNDKTKYVKKPVAGLNNVPEMYMAEPPKVHIRKGDYTEIYDGCVSPDDIEDGGHYRSIHYNMKYHGQNIEIQIRTLFEEGWGEIDHHIVYPYKTGNPMLGEYSELLNRLAGMADEMSSFYRRIKELDVSDFVPRDVMAKKSSQKFNLGKGIEGNGNLNIPYTVDGIINGIINE